MKLGVASCCPTPARRSFAPPAVKLDCRANRMQERGLFKGCCGHYRISEPTADVLKVAKVVDIGSYCIASLQDFPKYFKKSLCLHALNSSCIVFESLP